MNLFSTEGLFSYFFNAFFKIIFCFSNIIAKTTKIMIIDMFLTSY